MARLLDLSNDILLTIIEITSAGDIGSLASCCPKLHHLSQKKLQFHKQKRAEAEEIWLGWNTCEWEIHPLKHLQDIFENDDIRFYTRVIRIGHLGPEHSTGIKGRNHVDTGIWTTGDPPLVEERKIIATVKSQYEHQISALVAEVYDALLPHAISMDLREWTDNIISGDREAIAILLLALYPYLETLEIWCTCRDWFGDEKTTEGRKSLLYEHSYRYQWMNLFRSLTAKAREPGTNKLKIFSKLSKFHSRGGELKDWIDNLGPVTPFMALPTMRRIHCQNVTGHNVPWPYGIATSNVTNLTLKGDIDKASIRNVLRGLKRLKDFRYHFISIGRTGHYGDYRDRMKWGPHNDTYSVAKVDPDEPLAGLPHWEPRAITECLLQYACNSLVSLELGACTFELASDLSDDEPFIPSLRPFQALTHVHLDTMMLFEKVERPETIPVIGESFFQGNLQDAIKAQKLVDLLPVSIEELCISCDLVGKGLSKGEVEAMFMGLPERKDRLPKLSRLKVALPVRSLEADREGWEELIKRCHENEIAVFFNGQESETPYEAFGAPASEE